MLMCAIFILRLLPNFVVSTSCSNSFFDFFLINVLEFKSTAFIGMSARKCLCSPGLLPYCYQILHKNSFRWLVFHTSIVFFSKFIFFITRPKDSITVFEPTLLLSPIGLKFFFAFRTS